MSSEPTQEILAHKDHVNAVEFSPDGGFLVSAGKDGLVKLWRVGEWELFSTFFGHRRSADSLSFDPDGSVLATASTDRTVRIWSFPFGREERVEEGLPPAVISPDGLTVASLDRENRIRVWPLEEESGFERLDHEERVTAVAFGPDGKHLVTATDGSEMIHWELDGTPREVGRIPWDGLAVAGLRFFDGGRRLAASGHEVGLRVYDTGTWDEVVRVDLDGEGAFPLAVAPDGGEMAVGTVRRVRTFGAEGGALRAELDLPCKGVYGVAYSPGGEWLVVAGSDRRIRIWDRGSLP